LGVDDMGVDDIINLYSVMIKCIGILAYLHNNHQNQ
jgi:hypothetical protein